VVEVKDTGRGITEAGLKKLFKPFAQEDQSISKNFGGTGLGLCICHDLVTIMGGKIDVKSARKICTTFTVSIPL
jgi:signal transduction histidine kinase